jgi:hypothetical protein
MPHDAFAAAYDLVLRILKTVGPTASLRELHVEPPDHYTIRIDLPGEIGKTLIVTRQMVDLASVNRAALRSLELLLRSAVLRQRSHRAIDAGQTGAGLRPPAAETRTLVRACEECGKPITLRDRLVVREARLFHRECDARRAA